jgi:hypothetical protein
LVPTDNLEILDYAWMSSSAFCRVYSVDISILYTTNLGEAIRDGSSGLNFGQPVGFAFDGCGCIFAPVTWTRTRPAQNWVWVWVSFFTRGCTQNSKEIRKTQNPKETQKTPERNPKTPERNPFTKPDGHSNPTRNPTGSSAKFHQRIRVRVSNSTRLHFFTGRIFDKPDLNRPVAIPRSNVKKFHSQPTCQWPKVATSVLT